MGQKSLQTGDVRTIIATEAITEKRIVALDGSHTVKRGVGIAQYSTDSADPIPLITSGIVDVESGGIFAAGDLLTADANGKAVKADPAAVAIGLPIQVIGIAAEAAGGAGEFPLVMIAQQTIYGSLDNSNPLLDAPLLDTMVAGEAITADRIVDAECKHAALKGIGVATVGALQGADVAVAVNGIVNVTTGGNFAIGDPITADADGKAVKADPATSLVGVYIGVVGYAIEQSTGTGQTKKIVVSPSLLAGTDTE